MFNKNGMQQDTFSEVYKQMKEHQDEIKKKSRKVRECLEAEGFCFPDTPTTSNGNGDTKAPA